eukprot:1186553-Prorocentrum_minimum.AAC.1
MPLPLCARCPIKRRRRELSVKPLRRRFTTGELNSPLKYSRTRRAAAGPWRAGSARTSRLGHPAPVTH